jgi:mRNA interferase YafQ
VYILTPTTIFKRDLKRLQKRGKLLSKLKSVLEQLARGEELPAKNYPHKLSGAWSGKLECHIEPDWLLVYEYKHDLLILHRSGTHSDLFRK